MAAAERRIITTLRGLWQSEITRLLLLLLIGKVFILLAIYIADGTPDFLHLLSTRWDAVHFQTIADQGYIKPELYAFSPIYPYLMKGLSYVFGNSWVSGFIITNVLSFLFPVILYRTFGYRTALLATMFPIYLVFTTVVYSDILSLVFLALSLMFLLRKQMISAFTFASLAMLSAYRALWILPSYLILIIREKRIGWIFLYAIPGIAGVMLLWWFHFNAGDALIYLEVEESHWGVHMTTPVEQIKWLLNTDGQGWFTAREWNVLGVSLPPYYWLIRNYAFGAFYLVGAFFLLKTQNEHRHFLLAFSLFSIIPQFFIIGTPAISIPRLLLTAFPIFLGYTVAWGKKYDWIYIIVSLALAVIIGLLHMYSFFA